nr:MAG TPA: hypothetical protein [Bacteriophage sp.]
MRLCMVKLQNNYKHMVERKKIKRMPSVCDASGAFCCQNVWLPQIKILSLHPNIDYYAMCDSGRSHAGQI